MTKELEDHLPDEKGGSDSPFLDPAAKIVGDVEIRNKAFLLPGCMVDGDGSEVYVGEGSIIVNHAFVSSTEDKSVFLGKESFVSPGARLEGCSLEEGVLVGMDSVVMEGAEVGKESIVGTNAIVPRGMKIPERKVVLGQPAEIVKDVSEEDLEKIDEIRKDMYGKRKEFQIIEQRGERFGVFETPKRPHDILEENRAKKRETKKKDVPDMEKVKESLKELEKDNHTF